MNYPKIIKVTFRFPAFVPACKISVYFICSISRYSQMTRPTAPVFDHVQPKNLNQLLVFLKSYQNPKKSSKFIDMLWRYPTKHSS